jgi:hypothetical protein
MGSFQIKAFHISSVNNCIADAVSRGQFQKFKKNGTISSRISNYSTKGVLEPFKHEIMNLIESSLSLNTWNVYDNAINVFVNFRLNYNLEHKWPVPVSDLINFIVYLSSESYSPNTAKSYLARLDLK